MTIEVQIPRQVFIGNGTRGPFQLQDGSGNAIRLRIATDLVVWRYASTTDEAGEQLVYATDYAVSNVDPDNATFTLAMTQDVLSASQRLVAYRSQDVAQNLDLTLGGNYGGPADMAQRDIVTEQLQELRRDVDRSIKAAALDETPPTFPPKVVAEAGDLLGFDSDKNLVPLRATSISALPLLLDPNWLAALGAPLGDEWADAFIEDLGLGWKEALAQSYPDFYVDSYRIVLDVDDTNAWTRAAAALQAAGGGTLIGSGKGNVYTVNPAVSATMCAFTSLPFVGLRLSGAKLERTDALTAGQLAVGFSFTNCQNIHFPDVLFEDLNAQYGNNAPDRGMQWLTVLNTCRSSHFAGSIEGGNGGLAFIRGIAQAYNTRAVGSHFINLYCKKVAYSLSIQNGGDGVHGHLTSIQAYRDVIAYGHNDMDLKVVSQDQFSQTLLNTVNQAVVTGGAECANWRFNWTRLPNSGDVTAGGSGVVVRFWGNNGPQYIRNADITVVCLEPTVTQAFTIIAQTDASANDTSPPAHKIDGKITVRYPNAPANEVVTLFDDPKWASVDATGLSYDIVIGGNAAATAVIGNYAFESMMAEYAVAPVLTREGARPYSNYGAYSCAKFTPVWGYQGGSGFALGNAQVTNRGFIERVTEWDENNEADFIISASIVFGNTSNFGTGGALYFSLPSPFNALNFVNATARFPAMFDQSATWPASVRCIVSLPGKFVMQTQGTSFANVSNAAPETWDDGEGIYIAPFRIRLTR